MGLIYLDTCVVIYAFENDSVFGAEARQALAMHPAASFAVSPLVKMECLVSPFKQNNSILQNFYERGLSQFFPTGHAGRGFYPGGGFARPFWFEVTGCVASGYRSIPRLFGILDE